MISLGKRISYAFRCFFSIVSNGEIPEDLAPEVVKAPAAAEAATPLAAPAAETTRAREIEAPGATADRAVQMLALLQRDGRLIDFFTEDLTPYEDAQIGAAVRSMHEGCRQVLERYIKIEPVIAAEENEPVTIDSDFDPAAIKLIGNVAGKPPVRGLLRHRGWRVKETNLPPLPASNSRSIIAPAEVEID
jgi:hypothetical protein